MVGKITFPQSFVRFNRLFCFLVHLAIFIVMLQACGGSIPAKKDLTNSRKENPKSFLKELVRRYETRNPAGFLDRVHSRYEDIEGNRNDLRYRVSRVTDQFGNIEIQLYEVRTLQDTPRVLEVRWTMRWVCRTAGSGCYREDETVERSGRSEFVLAKESEKWKLREQRGSVLFGNFQPGRLDQ